MDMFRTRCMLFYFVKTIEFVSWGNIVPFWLRKHFSYPSSFFLTPNTAECLQFQLNKFHTYTRFKGLKLNTDKTKVMVFFGKDTSAIPTFTYDGTPLELVTRFKYLGFTLTRDGSMRTAAKKMADNFRSTIARVYIIGHSKGIKQGKLPCCGFSRSSLWQLACMDVNYGPLFHWHMIPQ